MAAEFCDGFKLDALNDLIASQFNNAKLYLYKALTGGGHAVVLGDFTPADFTGFAPITLSSWPAAALDGSYRAYSTHPDVVFTQTGTGTTCIVYGWYMTDDTGSYLIAYEPNPAGGQNMNLTGLTYVVGVTVGTTNLSEP